MSVSASPSLQRFRSAWLLPGWSWRIVAIIAVFIAQGLGLTVCFDAGSMAESSSTWGWLFGILPLLPRIGLCLIVATSILGWTRFLDHVQELAQAVREYRRWPLWWTGQWLAFAALALASQVIFDDEAAGSSNHAVWIAMWLAFAAACGTCCLCAIAPPVFWWRLAIVERWTLLTGLVTSLAATFGGRLFQVLWNPLGESTFRLVAWWLSFFYTESIVSDVEHRLLGTESFYVQIAPQCSGYEGIGLITVFVLAFLAGFRQTLRFPRAWLLLPAGILLIWICNSLRIAALIVIGTEYSASVALGGFHSQAGWILFNLVSLGLMAGVLQSEFFSHRIATAARTTTTAAVPYLVPFLVLTALSMVIAAFVDDPSSLYPLVVLVSLATLLLSRATLRRLHWTWSSLAIRYGIGVFLAWIGLAWVESQMHEVTSTPLPACDTAGGLAWTILRVFGAVVTVPVIEELAFRGFFLRRLCRTDFEQVDYRSVPIWAVLVSALAFGLLHQLWMGGIAAGLAYAWVTRKQGNLASAIQAHAITNALLAITVLTTGATWLW
ncbi:MAG: exosortase E/protease, VPEID-CTERM system [Planctomycetes bacterium]|nr:exosortase E/protease, VPEID-CTERM system [Planctomycetota bacterium]